jgi:hypothetical protein
MDRGNMNELEKQTMWEAEQKKKLESEKEAKKHAIVMELVSKISEICMGEVIDIKQVDIRETTDKID